MYGPDSRKPGSYASNCILARRLAERGVRFIQLYHMGWDHHEEFRASCRHQCLDTDQPSAALIQDLKQRGMLDDTLVVWGGEFVDCLLPGKSFAGKLWPGPSSAVLYRMDGRRGDEAGFVVR